MIRISLFVGERSYRTLKRMAQQRERGIAELFRDALDRYLEDAARRTAGRKTRRRTKARKR